MMEVSVRDKIDSFFEAYPLRIYPKGQILIFPREPPEHVYFVEAGSVKVYDISYRGEEVIINLFKNPAFFPMSWVVNRVEDKFFYATETASSLRVASTEDTYEFIKSNPDVLLDLLQRIYRGVDGVLERMTYLMSGSARSRIIYEIVIDCKRFALKLSDNTHILSTNEVGLAARTGLSRETVSREIHKLKEKKLLRVTPGAIMVRNVTKMEQLLSDSF